jgi:REP element-mobilizing transposase RayT
MKPNTFTRLYVHCVFTPKGRQALLKQPIREKTEKYIYGIIKGKKCYPIAINGTEDHLHILVGFNPVISISDLIRDIKRSSSLFINSEKTFPFNFYWQEGFGAFTVGHRELDNVYKYILNQELHHSRQSFRNEYTKMLDDEGFSDYDRYLFEFYD